MTLTGRQKRHLRALGHHLRPVVQVGHAGLTEAVIAHTVRALADHELVKVRSPDLTHAAALAGATGAVVVQQIGHTMLLYRRRGEDPVIVLPT